MNSWLRTLIVMALGAIVLVPTSASGHDHHPPKTVLRHGGETVRDGYLHQYCWVTSFEGGKALTECTDNVWSFPRRRLADVGDRVVIRIRKASPPSGFSVQAWPMRGDEISGPEGEMESLPFTTKPRIVKGETVAWNVVLEIEEPNRHYFIRAGGTWSDEQGAKETQDAFWLFHVRT